MKSQTVRLIDVFALGPLMVYVGARAAGVPMWARVSLAVSGVLTVTYNGKNYLAKKKRFSS